MSPKRPTPKTYTPEERQRILTQVKQAIKAGETVGEAVKAQAISFGTYYTWLKGKTSNAKPKTPSKVPRRPKAAPEHITLALDTPFNRSLALSLINALQEVLK